MTTTQDQDIYTSHPAFPILASTLLPLPAVLKTQPPAEHRTNPTPTTITTTTTTWSLEPSLSNAFSRLSGHDNISSSSNNKNSKNQNSEHLLRCGIIIGLSYLREWWDILGDSDSDSRLTSRNRDLLGDLSRRLFASFLWRVSLPCEEQQQQLAEHESEPTRVFIIHPVQSTTFAPETLFESLVIAIKENSLDSHEAVTTDPISPPEQALRLLDQVELLPVHDFASATQAISQVSDTLSHLHQSYQEQRHDNVKDDDGKDDDPPTTLLIIEGLDTMTENIVHNSNAMRGSAVLTPALRTLTHLSRSHASFLSVLLVNTIALGPGMPPQQAQQSLTISSQSHPQTTISTTTSASASTSTGGLYSAFSRERPTQHKPERAGLSQNEPESNEPLPLLNTLLSRTLDQGIDLHLLLQGSGRSRALVEVIKDRTGDGLGMWCALK